MTNVSFYYYFVLIIIINLNKKILTKFIEIIRKRKNYFSIFNFYY